MTTKESAGSVPPGVRVEVPKDFGFAYGTKEEREWVERRQRIGKSLIKEFEELDEFYTDEKAFKKGCKTLGKCFTDWNLTGDEGPLPKPWGNPGAFEALIESDLDLSLWVLGLIHQTMAVLLEEPSKN